MEIPIRSNGEFDFSNLESNVRNHICANPEENVYELTVNDFERKKVVEYFETLGDFKINYKKSGGKKYEVKISAYL